jgi:3-hydroxyisobutyrate dehydrogenase-like beta-hydroxyacid dehydrogenase
MKIAFIGLGNMGAPMARNLIKAGHSLNLFDLNKTVLAELEQLGGTISASAREAAQDAELVITMLPAAAHVRSVWLGEDGVLAGIGKACRRWIAAPSTRRPPAMWPPLPPNKAWPWPMHRSPAALAARRPAR